MKCISKVLLLSPLVALIFNIPAYGFLNLSGVAEGLCGNYSAFAKGYDAVDWNPANLVLLDSMMTINIGTAGVDYNSNISFPDLWKLVFTGHYYSDEEKGIFDKQLTADVLAGGQTASVSWADYAATAYLYSNNTVNLPKPVSQLIFYGNVIDTDTVYSLAGIKGAVEKVLVVSLSGAQNMGQVYQVLEGKFAVGATVKYLKGFYYMAVDTSSGELVTTMKAMKGDGAITYRTADGGFGWGMDLGFTYFTKTLNISVSLLNFVSDIMWNVNPQTVKMTFHLDSTDAVSFKQDTTFKSESVKNKSTFTTHEQIVIHIGSAMKLADVNTILLDAGYPGFIGAGINRSMSKVCDLRGGVCYKDSRFWGGLGSGVKIKDWNLDFGFCMSSPSRFSTAISLSLIR